MPKQSVKEVLSVSLRASSLKKEVTLAFYFKSYTETIAAAKVGAGADSNK